MLYTKGDDFDSTEIAAYSADVESTAENFKTLGQINTEKEVQEKK
jgi:hypothetical protein